MRILWLVVPVACVLVGAGCGTDHGGVLGQPIGPCDRVLEDVEDDLDAHANEISAFVLETHSSAVDLRDIQRDIERIDGVRSTSVTDKDAALERARKLFEGNPEVLEGLPGNPFPASVNVIAERDRIDEVVEAVADVDGIEEARQYGERARDWTERYRTGERQDELCEVLDKFPDSMSDPDTNSEL